MYRYLFYGTILYLMSMFQAYSQELDTLSIKTKTGAYAVYYADSLYYCPTPYIDSLCTNLTLELSTSTSILPKENYFIINEGNVKRYCYDRSLFKKQDSVYVNGEAYISTDEKPFRDDIIADELGCHKPKHSDCTRGFPFDKDDLRKRSIPFKGTLLRGLREGKWTYSSYDLLPIEEHYSNGIREGTYRVYIKKGEKDSTLYQTTFRNGTGIEKMYRDSYGKKYSLYRITHFKNGEQDLTYPLEEFHPNGKLARSTDYQKGIIISYYSTGVLRSVRVVSFLDSLTNGKPTPVPKVASYFDRQGELISTYTFDKEGKVLDSKTYQSAKILGRRVWYLERGNFKYYFMGDQYYQVDENGNEVEVEF